MRAWRCPRSGRTRCGRRTGGNRTWERCRWGRRSCRWDRGRSDRVRFDWAGVQEATMSRGAQLVIGVALAFATVILALGGLIVQAESPADPWHLYDISIFVFLISATLACLVPRT